MQVLNPINFLKQSPLVNSSKFFFFNESQNWVHLPKFYTLWLYRIDSTAYNEWVHVLVFSGPYYFEVEYNGEQLNEWETRLPRMCVWLLCRQVYLQVVWYIYQDVEFLIDEDIYYLSYKDASF